MMHTTASLVFRSTATFGIVVDSVCLLYFLCNASQFSKATDSWLQFIRLSHSLLFYWILAVIRLLTMMVFLYLFGTGSQFRNISSLYTWLLVNFLVVTFNWCLLSKSNIVGLYDSWMFLFAYVSILCQFICAQYLRSSVLEISSFSLGLTKSLLQETKQRQGETLIQDETEDVDVVHVELMEVDSLNNSNSEKTMRSNKFLYTLKKKIVDAQFAWNYSLSHIKHSFLNFSLIGKSSSAVLFYTVLTIFADDNLWSKKKAIDSINRVFSKSPDEVTFFIPQLTVYLLYGAFDLEDSLQQSMLSMCASSLTFACKFEWFLTSFCQQTYRGATEKDAVFQLIQLVRKSGVGASKKVINSPQLTNLSYGSIPRAVEKYPIQLTKEIQYLSQDDGDETYERLYLNQMRFWEELVVIARKIMLVPHKMRNDTLRRCLKVLIDHYLPSALIHVPFNNTCHRVHGIQVEECFAFSTKERAPLLICLEVIHYDSKPKPNSNGQSWWWRHPTRRYQPGHETLHEDHLCEENLIAQLPEDAEEFYQSSSAISRINSIDNMTNKSLFQSPPSNKNTTLFGQWISPIRTSSSQPTEDNTDDMYISPIRGTSFVNLFNEFDLYNCEQQSEAEVTAAQKSHRRGTISGDCSGWQSPDSLTYSTDNSSLPITACSTPNLKAQENTSCKELASPEAPGVAFKEKWRDKEKRLKTLSSVGKCLGWNLVPIIVKCDDDLRQEQLASQVIRYMHLILTEAKVNCWLRPYEIVALSLDSGIIEAIPNTVSLDVLKKGEFGYSSLSNFFEEYFGPVGETSYLNAVDNFIQSMAGYSIVCYLLNIKDRHNGNILLTTHGHILHIDFGFMLEKTPGGNISFEAAPFKLTTEYVSAMGGESSAGFQKFRTICVDAFLVLRQHHERIVQLMEMMSKGSEDLPCFAGNPSRAFKEMRNRFFPCLNDIAAADAVNDLINNSLDNWTTHVYDGYQRCCQGIQ